MDSAFMVFVLALFFMALIFAFAIAAMRGENRRSRLLNLHHRTTGSDRPDLMNKADATDNSHLYQQLAADALIHQAGHVHHTPQADPSTHSHHGHHHHHHSHDHHHHTHQEAPPVHHAPPPDMSSAPAPSFDSGSHHHSH